AGDLARHARHSLHQRQPGVRAHEGHRGGIRGRRGARCARRSGAARARRAARGRRRRGGVPGLRRGPVRHRAEPDRRRRADAQPVRPDPGARYAPASVVSELVAVVTGAGSGIGRAIAVALAEHGYRLALLDVVPGAEILECDVADPERVAEAFGAIDTHFGRVDLLVNNAVVPVPRAHPEDLALADWRRTLDVNLTGYFLCAQAAGKRMIADGRG